MKATVLDVLIYLFENHMDDEGPESGFDLTADRDSLSLELREAGFDDRQVQKAMEWLEGLASQRDHVEAAGAVNPSFRVFGSRELEKLDTECRGFLVFLEQVGVLDAHSRELVIDRIMALESDVDLEQVKWVVLMVLFNQPGHEEAFTWMEDVVMDELRGSLH